jgi:hypothetical protein
VENVTSSAAIRKWVPVVVFMTSRESVRESEG